MLLGSFGAAVNGALSCYSRHLVTVITQSCRKLHFPKYAGICTCKHVMPKAVVNSSILRCAGATLPMFAIIFGDIINALGGSPTVAQLVHQVNKVDLLSCTPQ